MTRKTSSLRLAAYALSLAGLLASGRARNAILSGGSMYDVGAEAGEARVLSRQLVAWGIDPARILLEEASRNTHAPVAPGAADRSYGIQVAKLAGLPPAVVKRAEQVLRALEKGDTGRKAATLIDDLPLFSAAAAQAAAEEPKAPPALAKLGDIDPDTLTPKDALELIYELKKLSLS